jgi:hypothetical protein
MRLAREGVHEPGDGEREDNEDNEVADGGEEALLGSGFVDARENDGYEQRAKKQGGKGREIQVLVFLDNG